MFVDRRMPSPFATVGTLDPFFGGFGFGHDASRSAAVRKRRAREFEAARRRDAWEQEQRRRSAALRSRRDRLARRVWGRTYNRAATAIQRAWRAYSRRALDARADAAAGTITRAVRNAGAVAAGRRILGALKELRRIEAEAMAVPAALGTERDRLFCEDTLEKITLRLDRVDSLGSPIVRDRRRAVVRAVQGRLAQLDDHRPGSGGESEADSEAESEAESEVDPEVAGWADAAAAPAVPGPGQPGEDFDDSDGWTEVTDDATDAEFEAAVERRNELFQRVAEARAELASLEAELAASEGEVGAMEGREWTAG